MRRRIRGFRRCAPSRRCIREREGSAGGRGQRRSRQRGLAGRGDAPHGEQGRISGDQTIGCSSGNCFYLLPAVGWPCCPTGEDVPDDSVNLEEHEKRLIRMALAKAEGNQTRAAQLLGISRHTLICRMQKHGLR